jgi:hypothetical protein
MNYVKKPTDLTFEINGKQYPVFMSQGSSRKAYYIYFTNRSLWYRVSGAECKELK